MKWILAAMFRKGIQVFGGHGIGKFYPMRVVSEFLFKHLKSDYGLVLGHRMFLDPNDSLRLSVRGIYEPLETELVQKEVRPGDVAVDVGANIGYYTLILARCVGPSGHVFAFEPCPENFVLLKKNVEVNGYRNVTLVQKAVSNTVGKDRLHLSDVRPGDHSLYDFGDGHRSIEVDVTTLDEYFKDYSGKVSFIKTDTQGADSRVIEGARGLMAKNSNLCVAAELWPMGLRAAHSSTAEFLRMLREIGFSVFQIDEGRKTMRPVEDGSDLETLPEKSGVFVNLLCKRNVG